MCRNASVSHPGTYRPLDGTVRDWQSGCPAVLKLRVTLGNFLSLTGCVNGSPFQKWFAFEPLLSLRTKSQQEAKVGVELSDVGRPIEPEYVFRIVDIGSALF